MLAANKPVQKAEEIMEQHAKETENVTENPEVYPEMVS
jgi:hypothetical protein